MAGMMSATLMMQMQAQQAVGTVLLADGMMQGLKKGPMSPSPFGERPKAHGQQT